MASQIRNMYANPARAEEHIAALNGSALVFIDAAAPATGAAPTVSFPGLLANDNVVGHVILAPGSTPAAIQAITSVANNQAVVHFSADPGGSGAQVRLLVHR